MLGFLALNVLVEFSESMENGTRLSLFALPSFAYAIASAHSDREGWTLADIGAGPTVYSAMCFRNTVDKVYLADYLPESVSVVRQWAEGKKPFDWSGVIRVVARYEHSFNYKVCHCSLTICV